MLRILKIVHITSGVIGAVIVLVMSITGLLLNHRSLIGYSTETSVALQKFIFGLHSGTIGKHSIIWLTDLGAICMMILSITGIWMWGSLLMKRRKGIRIDE